MQKNAKITKLFSLTASWCTGKREREERYTELKCVVMWWTDSQQRFFNTLYSFLLHTHTLTLTPSNLCQHRPPTLPVFKRTTKNYKAHNSTKVQDAEQLVMTHIT